MTAYVSSFQVLDVTRTTLVVLGLRARDFASMRSYETHSINITLNSQHQLHPTQRNPTELSQYLPTVTDCTRTEHTVIIHESQTARQSTAGPASTVLYR